MFSPVLPRFVAFISLSAALAASLSPATAAEKSVWQADDARTKGPGMLLPDSKGSLDFEILDASGISIGEKPKGGSDAKSLVFSGEQVLAFQTVQTIPAPYEGFKLKALVNVSDLSADTDITLFRHGTSWEIRYLVNRSAFLFVVWHDAGERTEVVVPARAGEWQELLAEYEPEKMILKVDGVKAEDVPKAAMVESPKPQSLILGASAPRPVEGALPRGFRGAVAEIEIDWK